MTIFVTVPGMKKEPVIISDTATVADFCRAAFEHTGVSFFSGFGYKGQSASGTISLNYQNPFLPKNIHLNVPAAPTLTASSVSGTLAANTYFVVVTYVNTIGETLASTESSITTTAAGTVTVASPAALAGATGYNVYMATTSGSETKQNGATPVAIGTAYNQTAALAAGAALPTANTAVTFIDQTTGAGMDPTFFFIPAPAAAATATATTGGSIAAGTYNVRITYVNPAGESLASVNATQVTTGTTSTITITSPAASGDATGYNVYAGTGTPTKQGGTTAIGTNVTLTTVGAGAALPASNTAKSPVVPATTLLSALGLSDQDEVILFNSPLGG